MMPNEKIMTNFDTLKIKKQQLWQIYRDLS